MTASEFRDKLIERIDALLGRPLLVWGDDRRLLAAVRGYLDVMPEVELTRMQGFYHERGTIMQCNAPLTSVGIPQDVADAAQKLKLDAQDLLKLCVEHSVDAVRDVLTVIINKLPHGNTP